MPARPLRTPKYRHHKPSGQAVVTLNDRDFYLGRYGSEQSHAEYKRLLAEWLSIGRQVGPPSGGPADLSVNELCLAYLRHAEAYYRKNGKPTKEPANIKLAIRPLRHLYGHTVAREFGPLALKAVRQAMIESDLCRTEVNKRVRHVVRVFKWGVENELVPPSVHHGLKALSGLKKGRSNARESEPVKPVPDALVEAIKPHVARQVWAMVQLQRLTGMRPGEVTIMRTCDLDTSSGVWVYTPESHKTEHHGKDRVIYLGPRAQVVLKPWLRTDLAAYLFQPREAIEEYRAGLRRNRRTPVQPSQQNRRKRIPRKSPGERYSTESYARAIAYGCKRAFPHPRLSKVSSKKRTADQRAELSVWHREHHWHPHQLRHNAATWLRKEFGLDVARVVLGHSSAVVTEVYAEVDREKAMSVMERVG